MTASIGDLAARIGLRGRRPLPAERRILMHLERCFDAPRRSAPTILYLGDSVAERVARQDNDRRSLGELLVSALEPTAPACVVSHSAYNPSMHELLLGCVLRLRSQPRVLLLAVNLRAFSPQWADEPRFRFERHRAAYRAYIGGQRRPRIAGRDDDPVDRTAFLAQSTHLPLSTLKSNAEFDDLRRARPTEPSAVHERLRNLIIYHYGFEVRQDNAEVIALTRLLDNADKADIRVVAYLTPMNWQHARERVGAGIESVISHNVNTLEHVLRDNGAETYDFSRSLDSGHFFHNDETTEHLNSRGRLWLATALAEAASHATGGRLR